jgi:hypothetical protein
MDMNITYASLSRKYNSKEAPRGFCDFTKKHGIARPNTCAVRLAYALFECDKKFFKSIQAKSRIEWFGLPTKAADLAIILNQKLGKAVLVTSEDEISGPSKKTGIIFFDTIAGSDVSGHISLWDGTEVVDDGNHFSRSPRTYFWRLI